MLTSERLWEVLMSSSTRWTLATVLLVPAVVLPLLVGVYDRQTPYLWGFPFYYWFQFALIPLAAVLTSSAYLLVRETPARRDQRGRRVEPKHVGGRR